MNIKKLEATRFSLIKMREKYKDNPVFANLVKELDNKIAKVEIDIVQYQLNGKFKKFN